MAKFKAEKFTTGVGRAVYPYITSPDNKFPPEAPRDTYKVSLVLPADEHTTAIIAKLEEVRDAKHEETLADLKAKVTDGKGAAKAKAKKKLAELEVMPVYEDDFDEEGEETGNVVLKFKLYRVVKNGKTGETFTQSPHVFDCSKPPNPLTGIDIWKGSLIKVSSEVIPYFMDSTNRVGVSLRLKAVQVHKLVSAGQGDAASYGFDGDEGGFSQPTAPGASDFDDDAGGAGDGEDDDF